MVGVSFGNVGKGRRRIFDDREINESTIVTILMDAFNIHRLNVNDINFLMDYYKGQQNILKRIAPNTNDINNKVVLNYAYSSIRDIIGYTFGKPIQIVPRKAKFRKDIKKIIDIFEYENSSTVDNEAATYSAICGLSYLSALPSPEITTDYMPDIPLKLNALDITNTFVIQSADIGHPVRLSCTYWCDKKGKKTYFTAYTDTKIYHIVSDGIGTLSGIKNTVTSEDNMIGLNPIQLIENNKFLMGDFEVAIGVLDALNQTASDSVNDVENAIKCLLVLINSQLDEESTKKLASNRILELLGAPGANVDAKFLYQQLDSVGITQLREYLEEAYRVIIGIPDRKTRGGGGGDTGDAVKLRDGWADIEIVARFKESYFKIAKKKQIGVAIKILQKLGEINKEFKLIDLDVKFPRNKNDNLQTKAQSYSTLVGTNTLDPTDALEMCDMTTDVAEVIERGKKYQDEKQERQLEYQQKQQEQKLDNNYNYSNVGKTDANRINESKSNEKSEKIIQTETKNVNDNIRRY